MAKPKATPLPPSTVRKPHRFDELGACRDCGQWRVSAPANCSHADTWAVCAFGTCTETALQGGYCFPHTRVGGSEGRP